MHAPADNVTPPLSASPSGLRQFLRTTLGSALLSAVICAALWIAISYATGGSALFSLGGGILIGVIVFIIGYGVRLILDRRTSLI
jgi:ABC-type transport system involved in cytochrome bd biosynthesis fused ATPase/permease subunit